MKRKMKKEINIIEALTAMRTGEVVSYYDEESGCELHYRMNVLGDVLIAYDEDEEFTEGVLPEISNIMDKIFYIELEEKAFEE